MTKENKITPKQAENISAAIRREFQKMRECGASYPHYTRKLGKVGSLKIELLKDGKPSTIQAHTNEDGAKIKNINFYLVYFNYKVGQARYITPLKLAKWDGFTARPVSVNGNKWGLLDDFYRVSDCEKMRRECSALFLVSVPELYTNEDAQKKHNRQENRPNPTTAERLKDLTKAEDKRADGVRFTRSVYSWGGHYVLQQFDACGYRLDNVREQLKKRAQELHKTRAVQKWKDADHSEYINELNQIAKNEKNIIVELLQVDDLNFYARHFLEDVAQCIEDVQNLKNDIKEAKIYDQDTASERMNKARANYKKIKLLEPLKNDPAAYGFSWWKLDGDALRFDCSVVSGDKYYKRITADGGEF